MSEAAVPGGMRGRIGAVTLLSDDRLARRAVKGDERAFAAIFDRYHQDLHRFCLAIVGNSEDAQDALQNTMVKVLRALPGEERRIELKPWLYRIAHNESVELLRRRRPAEELDPELTAARGGLAENAETRARLRQLIADLEQLPERQRGALVMRELAGLDFAEIGTALGTSPAVARQTLYEARLSLRKMDEGREMSCDAVTRALSDADGRVARRRDIRAHLRACPECRCFREEIAGRRADLGALAPLPAVAAAGLLQGLLGGSASGSAGAGLAGAATGGAAKSLGTAAAIKSAAAVAVVAAVGVGAADRSGVVDVTPWGAGSSQQQSEPAGVGGAVPAQSQPGEPGVAAGDGSAAVESAAALGAGVRSGSQEAGSGLGDGGAAATTGAPASAGSGEGSPALTEPGAGGSHPHGRGHEKRHPDAAAHGQETATSHKATGKGVGGGRGGGADKSHPSKPTKPAKPVKPPKSSQSAANGGGKVVTPPKAPADPGAAAPPGPSPSAQAGEAKAPSTPPRVGQHP